MRPFCDRLLVLLLALSVGGVASATLHAADEEPGVEVPLSSPPQLIAQAHRLGSVDVVVLNADGTPVEIRRETAPLVTALLTMSKARKDEKCTAVLWSRRPNAKCAIIKTKNKKKKK